MLGAINGFLRARPKGTIASLAFVLTASVALLDYSTGSEISFSVLYLLPISLASWYATKRVGVIVALAAAATWYLTEVAAGFRYSHFAIPILDALVRFGFYLITVALLAKLRSQLELAAKLATTDALTGLANRRSFYERFAEELSRAARYSHPLTLACLDLDNFKAVNDAAGHEAGDVVLKVVGDTIKHPTRQSDVTARIGGDEFVVLFPETGYDAARPVIQKVRAALAHAMQAGGWPVTFSVGVVTFERPTRNVEEMMRAADDVMYSVKKTGKGSITHTVWPGTAAVA